MNWILGFALFAFVTGVPQSVLALITTIRLVKFEGYSVFTVIGMLLAGIATLMSCYAYRDILLQIGAVG